MCRLDGSGKRGAVEGLWRAWEEREGLGLTQDRRVDLVLSKGDLCSPQEFPESLACNHDKLAEPAPGSWLIHPPHLKSNKQKVLMI